MDGLTVSDPAHPVVAQRSEVAFDGQPVVLGSLTIALNKPLGVITATRDATQKTVLDLFPPAMARRLTPAGRLDKDTEGLLILTDDGALSHRLTAPKYAVEKEYLVTVDQKVPEDLPQTFARGLTLRDGYTTRPADLVVVDPGPPGIARVTITEGKYHQVRRMFAAAGLHVTALKRIRIGSLFLPEELGPGEYRRLQPNEVEALTQNPTIPPRGSGAPFDLR